MVRWLGERLTIGQFVSATDARVSRTALPLDPAVSNQFNAIAGIFSRLLCSLPSDRVRQRRMASSVGPA
jgi:hypothetical protein